MSAVTAGSGDKKYVCKYDRTINNGCIPNWIYISDADKKKFISEGKKQGLKFGHGKGSNTGN